MLGLDQLMLRLRSRAVWRDPVRTVLTLESFSRTEADGGADIGSAAGKVADEELRGHLLRHTEDEIRHAKLFADRATELRKTVTVPPELELDADSDQYDLSRGRAATEVDAHGFFTAGLLDELGEVAYVAMLHEAEKRAALLFQVHADLTTHDAGTNAVFEEILRDEKYHVAYTRTILDKWREGGRGREVDEALSAAKAGRALSAWKRLGVRSAAGFSHVVLRVIYFTLMVPFGLAGRMSRRIEGWQSTDARAPLGERLTGQA